MLSAGNLGSSFASVGTEKKTGSLQRLLEVRLISNFLSQNKPLNQFIELCVWGVECLHFLLGREAKLHMKGCEEMEGSFQTPITHKYSLHRSKCSLSCPGLTCTIHCFLDETVSIFLHDVFF